MSQGSQDTRLLGYLWLQPGLSKMNGYTLLWACLTGIPFLVVINFIQPYILSAMLNVPQEEQGTISANLAVVNMLPVPVLERTAPLQPLLIDIPGNNQSTNTQQPALSVVEQ